MISTCVGKFTWYLSHTLNSKVIAPTTNDSTLNVTENCSLIRDTSAAGRLSIESKL